MKKILLIAALCFGALCILCAVACGGLCICDLLKKIKAKKLEMLDKIKDYIQEEVSANQ